ncbi:ShlB/FhaC/HecB family hemolysin secretion/activation protein [Leptolyngbya sp. FACHB-671]|uniref:ShlB/FhaC/HecB family hemolysin secretion/activation protein n=1 Tax=Leptolyngbya sp. FACHB-671 TaxID=2692812 RepID=UPI001F558044|nr:ShlB/FhaC/HecB family hemolysin secretion/activation protein [Leptolyngbya sp. FACHB-671]
MRRRGSGVLEAIALYLTLTVSMTLGVTAQTPPMNLPDDLPDPAESDIPNTIDQITPRSPSEEPLPLEPPTSLPSPILEPSTVEAPGVPNLAPVQIRVNSIEVRGNSIFEQEIDQLIQPLLGREVSFDQLIALRSAITALYTSQGYITSGAFLPNNQDLSDGVVQIQVVEGELEAVNVEGLERLNSSYVRSRLTLAGRRPLNQQNLERALQLLQVDPLLRQVNAELTAGSAPGLSILQVDLQEAPLLTASLGTNNYQPTSIGSAQLTVAASYTNVMGIGDRLSAQYGRTSGLDLYDISYSLPVNPRDGSLTLRYNTNDSRIIEDAVEDLGIRSEAESWSLEFRQPLSRSVTEEFALGLALDLRRSQTYILDDIPFSFSAGADEGESRVTVLRFSQDWVNRGRTQVLAARSQFSIGLDALDATINDTGTDAEFFKWLGQFQWVRQIEERSLLVTRLNAQLTPDSLLSLEKIGLGGQDTIRGYAQNQLVADNAIWTSVELRLPLNRSNRLELIPFLEAGHAWNSDLPDPDPDFLVGAGLGLRWEALRGLNLRVDYGLPLIGVDSEGDSLQDNGIYLSVQYFPW